LWDDRQRAIFQNRAITKKVFLLGHSVQNSNVHPVDQNRDLEEISKNYWTTCMACGKKVQTGLSFVQHLTACKGKKRRTCQECKKIFDTKELMLAHAKVMHMTKCLACDKKFRVGKTIKKHWSLCQQNNRAPITHKKVYRLVCEYCEKVLITRNERRNHVKQNHPEEMSKNENKVEPIYGIMTNHCQFCTDVFKIISQYYEHARVVHKDAVQKLWIPCLNCKKYFPTKKSLKIHKTNTCLDCEHCNKVLNSRNERRNHVEQNHLEEMSKYWTKCLICDIKFRVGRSLSCHLKLCRQINHPEEMSKVWKRCKACDKKIQTGQNFVQHMTICNGKKLLNNTMACNKKFLVGRSFTKHWNKCQQNQVRCQICKEIFSTKEVMLAHARVMHVTHVELFWCSSCPDCKLTFPSMAEVKEHVCVIKLSQTKKDLNLDNIDVTLEWLMSKTITTITMLDV
jgi:thiol-disulfide isomerase/thioredoxin